SFNLLDQRFTFTTAKPKLYFQPVAADLARDRRRALAQTTSRDWDEVRRRPLGGVDGQLRRYTFEDGVTLVDGGPDRGSFGVPNGYLRGGGGGRGRRGRGRW
ncbi:SAP domain protein, partial [Teratosphaeria destructans]